LGQGNLQLQGIEEHLAGWLASSLAAAQAEQKQHKRHPG